MWKQLWKLNLFPRIHLFIWKLLHDGIAVQSELNIWNLGVIKNCVFCEKKTETQNHLFLDCKFVRMVWFGTSLTLRRENIEPISVKQWIFIVSQQETSEQLAWSFYAPFLVVLWCIWQYRNRVVFQGVRKDSLAILTQHRVMMNSSLVALNKGERLNQRELLLTPKIFLNIIK